MTARQQTSLYFAFALVVLLLVLLIGGTLPMLTMSNSMTANWMLGSWMTNSGMMGNGLMGNGMTQGNMMGVNLLGGMTWMWIPSLLTLAIGILIAWAIFTPSKHPTTESV